MHRAEEHVTEYTESVTVHGDVVRTESPVEHHRVHSPVEERVPSPKVIEGGFNHNTDMCLRCCSTNVG